MKACGFAVLERAWSFMQETRQSFEVALAVTRAGISSHHTAWLPALTLRSGMIEQYLGSYAARNWESPS